MILRKQNSFLLSESQSGNVLAVYDLGKLYSTDKLGERNEEMSVAKYTRALQGFLRIEPNSKKLKPYVQYRIGKMFCYGLGTEQDYEKAFEWFERSAKQKNKFAQFSLANLYYYGSGVEKDLSQAFSLVSEIILSGAALCGLFYRSNVQIWRVCHQR